MRKRAIKNNGESPNSTQGYVNKYMEKIKKKRTKLKKIRQMKNIQILAEHSTLDPGPWTLPVERLKRVNKLIQIQYSWPRGPRFM
jgi:hypothetical protein